MMARLYIDQGKIAEGLNVFEHVLEKDPKNTQILIERACFYTTHEEYKSALNDYLQLLQIKQNPSLLMKCAQISHKLGELESALEYYNQFLNVKPDDSFSLSERGKGSY